MARGESHDKREVLPVTRGVMGSSGLHGTSGTTMKCQGLRIRGVKIGACTARAEYTLTEYSPWNHHLMRRMVCHFHCAGREVVEVEKL